MNRRPGMVDGMVQLYAADVCAGRNIPDLCESCIDSNSMRPLVFQSAKHETKKNIK